MFKKLINENGLVILILCVSYYFGYIFSLTNSVLSFLVLSVAGISIYFIFSKFRGKNYLNFVSIFSAVWMVTVGLSQLRILDYQVSWSNETWGCLFIANIMFILGNIFSRKIFTAVEPKYINSKVHLKYKSLYLRILPETLFWVITIFSCLGIVSFIINVIIKG